jgi:hypothetical protein
MTPPIFDFQARDQNASSTRKPNSVSASKVAGLVYHWDKTKDESSVKVFYVIPFHCVYHMPIQHGD